MDNDRFLIFSTFFSGIYMISLFAWFYWRTLAYRPWAALGTKLFVAAEVLLRIADFFVLRADLTFWLEAALLILLPIFCYEEHFYLGWFGGWMATITFGAAGALLTLLKSRLLPGAETHLLGAQTWPELALAGASGAILWGVFFLLSRLLRAHPGWRKAPRWLLLPLCAADLALNLLPLPDLRASASETEFAQSLRGLPLRDSFIILVACALVLLAIYILWSIWNRRSLRRERALLQTSLLLQREYLQSVQENRRQMQSLRHDMNNHLQTAARLLQYGAAQDAQAYLQQLLQQVQDIGRDDVCENLLVNAILANKRQDAQARGVQLETQLQMPEKIPMADIDLTALLVNLLDNALQASRPGDCVELVGLVQNGLLTLEVKNPLHGHTLPERFRLLEDLRRQHGYGLSNVRQIAQPYNGAFTLRPKEDAAVATVTLYLTEPSAEHSGT